MKQDTVPPSSSSTFTWAKPNDPLWRRMVQKSPTKSETHSRTSSGIPLFSRLGRRRSSDPSLPKLSIPQQYSQPSSTATNCITSPLSETLIVSSFPFPRPPIRSPKSADRPNRKAQILLRPGTSGSVYPPPFQSHHPLEDGFNGTHRQSPLNLFGFKTKPTRPSTATGVVSSGSPVSIHEINGWQPFQVDRKEVISKKHLDHPNPLKSHHLEESHVKKRPIREEESNRTDVYLSVPGLSKSTEQEDEIQPEPSRQSSFLEVSSSSSSSYSSHSLPRSFKGYNDEEEHQQQESNLSARQKNCDTDPKCMEKIKPNDDEEDDDKENKSSYRNRYKYLSVLENQTIPIRFDSSDKLNTDMERTKGKETAGPWSTKLDVPMDQDDEEEDQVRDKRQSEDHMSLSEPKPNQKEKHQEINSSIDQRRFSGPCWTISSDRSEQECLLNQDIDPMDWRQAGGRRSVTIATTTATSWSKSRGTGAGGAGGERTTTSPSDTFFTTPSRSTTSSRLVGPSRCSFTSTTLCQTPSSGFSSSSSTFPLSGSPASCSSPCFSSPSPSTSFSSPSPSTSYSFSSSSSSPSPLTNRSTIPTLKALPPLPSSPPTTNTNPLIPTSYDYRAILSHYHTSLTHQRDLSQQYLSQNSILLSQIEQLQERSLIKNLRIQSLQSQIKLVQSQRDFWKSKVQEEQILNSLVIQQLKDSTTKKRWKFPSTTTTLDASGSGGMNSSSFDLSNRFKRRWKK